MIRSSFRDKFTFLGFAVEANLSYATINLTSFKEQLTTQICYFSGRINEVSRENTFYCVSYLSRAQQIESQDSKSAIASRAWPRPLPHTPSFAGGR